MSREVFSYYYANFLVASRETLIRDKRVNFSIYFDGLWILREAANLSPTMLLASRILPL